MALAKDLRLLEAAAGEDHGARRPHAQFLPLVLCHDAGYTPALGEQLPHARLEQQGYAAFGECLAQSPGQGCPQLQLPVAPGARNPYGNKKAEKAAKAAAKAEAKPAATPAS